MSQFVELTAEQREAEAIAAEGREHFLLAARIRRGDPVKARMLAAAQPPPEDPES